MKLNLKKHPEKYFEIDGNSHRLAYEVMPLDYLNSMDFPSFIWFMLHTWKNMSYNLYICI